MTFLGRHFYNLSNELRQEAIDGTSDDLHEARNRTSISRAYYGAFLECREKANIAYGKSDVHKAVIDFYQGNTISNRLIQLRALRNRADYDTEATITERESGRALKTAKKILDALNN